MMATVTEESHLIGVAYSFSGLIYYYLLLSGVAISIQHPGFFKKKLIIHECSEVLGKVLIHLRARFFFLSGGKIRKPILFVGKLLFYLILKVLSEHLSVSTQLHICIHPATYLHTAMAIVSFT